MGQNGFWTPERDKQVLALMALGKSSSEVAEAIGAASRSAVLGRLRRIGSEGFAATYDPWTDEHIAELRRLAGLGKDTAYIAKHLNRSRGAILGKASDLGIKVERARTGIAQVTRAGANSTRIKSVVQYRPGQIIARPDTAFRPEAGPDDVRYIDARPRLCRWFKDGHHGAYGLICACPTEKGESYCPEHRARVYQSPFVAERVQVAA